MKGILTLNKISHVGTDKFDKSEYFYGESVENPVAIIVRSASMHGTDFAPDTIAVARAGAGVNNIPVEKCSEKGICVFNTPGANANAVKELVILGLLMASRKIDKALEWCRSLKEEPQSTSEKIEKGKSAFSGPEIYGKKLGIIGLGKIGTLVANAALNLGMSIIGFDPLLTEESKLTLPESIEMSRDINDLFKKSDYISLHLPLNGNTKNLINESSLKLMKDGVRIVNFARGGLVNTANLLKALKTGKVSSYVTDFPDDEIIGVDGVTSIPHLGASTPESEENCASAAAEELIAYIEKGEIKNSVNLPDMLLDSPKGKRCCIIHRNDENVTEEIKKVLSSDIKTASKKDMAYTVSETSAEVDALKAIDGVKRVRIIG